MLQGSRMNKMSFSWQHLIFPLDLQYSVWGIFKSGYHARVQKYRVRFFFFFFFFPLFVHGEAHPGPRLTLFKGCGMGPWLVLVSPCFRENVVATCKIGSFLCSLDNLLQKKRNCSLFWESNFKMALI